MTQPPRSAGTVLGSEPPAAGEPEPISDGPTSPLEGPARAPGPRRARRAGGRRGEAGTDRSWWWTAGFPLALVALVVAIPVLVWVGARVVLDSNDGRLVRRVTDPAAPGWEAVVEPTPTDLVLTVAADGSLQGASVLVLTGDDSGGIIQIPAETLVTIVVGENPDGSPATSEISLGYQWLVGDAEGVRARVGELLNLTIPEVQVLDAEEWASLVRPVSPLTVNSPDAAVGPDGQVLFPKGSIQLDADDVGRYLGAIGPNQNDLSRLVRVEAFWRSWLTATAVAGTSALPTPVDIGLGRFVGALSGGQLVFETLPVTPAEDPNGGGEVYRPQTAAVEALVAELVPFPRGAPGQRPTVEVLDTTGRLDHGVPAAVLLGAAGGQIDVIGNAPEFGAAITEIIYYDDARRADADAMRQALGFGEVVKSNQKSAIDITVVLGEDGATLAGAGAVAPATLEGASDG